MEGTQKFLDLMMRYENLIIMFGAWVAVGVVGKVFPKFRGSKIGARLQPLAPFIFTMGACWLPGLLPPEVGLGERLMLGLILGWGSGHMHKILKQTLFGNDSRIKAIAEDEVKDETESKK